jgi:hypothetical protein
MLRPHFGSVYPHIGLGLQAGYMMSDIIDVGMDFYARVPLGITYYPVKNLALVAELGLGWGMTGVKYPAKVLDLGAAVDAAGALVGRQGRRPRDVPFRGRIRHPRPRRRWRADGRRNGHGGGGDEVERDRQPADGSREKAKGRRQRPKTQDNGPPPTVWRTPRRFVWRRPLPSCLPDTGDRTPVCRLPVAVCRLPVPNPPAR